MELRDNAINLARYYGKRIDAVFSRAAMIPSLVASRMETDSQWENRESIKRYLKRTVEMNPFIYGAAIALETDSKTGSRKPFGPYYYYNQGKLDYRDLSKDDYKYWQWEWFSQPKALGKPL